jgi:hypothetical protein
MFALHYRWLGLHNPQNCIFSLALNLGTYTPLLTLSGCLIQRNRIKKERKKKFQSTSTCIFNVHSTFIYFCTMLLIVGHHWVELEVPLYISFSCFCTLKSESSIIWITTCYFHRRNKLQISILIYHLHTRGRAWVKLGDVDACKIHAWTL